MSNQAIMRRTLLLLAALAVAALGACGPLPRPFKPEAKHDTTLAALGESAGVLVLPLEGDAPGAAAGAPAQLARALQALGIAAESDAAAAERLLAGRAEVSDAGEGHDAVAIDWQVTDPGGTTLGGFRQVSQLPAGLWAAGQAGAVGSVMARAAQHAAALLREPAAAGAGTGTGPAAARPRLVLLPMDDLPGDGSYALPRALERELAAADYEIGWDIGPEDLLILADMTVEPDGAGTELVSITWWVVRAEDGVDLGKVDQARQLPAGALEGPWGVLADGIAAGAAEGIVAVIRRRWRA